MRFKKTLLNYVGMMIPSILITFLTMYRTSVFIANLGPDAAGIEGTFFNLFSFIHLAEAGLGVAVITTLYKLVAADKHDEINRVLTGARHQMKRIAILVLGIGIILSILVPFVLNKNPYTLWYTLLLWFLYLFKSVIGYLVYAPSPLVSAHQNDYKLQIRVYMPIQVCTAIIEIILLLAGFDLLALVILGIILGFAQQFLLRYIIQRQYPWFHWTKKEDMDLSTKEKTKDIFVHKIATMVLYSTDNLVISTFVGVGAAGIYTQAYQKLFEMIAKYITPLFSTAESSLGNLYHSETNEKKLAVMNEQFDILLFISALVLIPGFILAQSFISLWLGPEMLAGTLFLALIVFIYYYRFTRAAIQSAIDLHALFKLTKVCAVIEAILNLALSLTFVYFFGMTGVLIGTTLSLLLTNFWYYPLVLYREVFNMKPWRYYAKYIGYTALFIGMIVLWQVILLPYAFPFLDQSTWIGWIISGVVVGGLNALVLILIFWNSSKGFRHFAGRFLNLFKEIKERRFSNSK